MEMMTSNYNLHNQMSEGKIQAPPLVPLECAGFQLHEIFIGVTWISARRRSLAAAILRSGRAHECSQTVSVCVCVCVCACVRARVCVCVCVCVCAATLSIALFAQLWVIETASDSSKSNLTTSRAQPKSNHQ